MSRSGANYSSAYVSATVVVGAGIDATGVTNSAAAIQAKINAAGAGGTLHFPKGTYLADGLVPLTGQTWAGSGTIKRPNASTASMITATDLDSFTMTELTIDGNRAGATATSNSAVFLIRASNCIISGVRFQNTPLNNPAMEIRGGTGNRITDNAFITVGYGVNICLAYGITDPCYNNAVTGNVFDGVDLNGIFLTENIGSQAGAVTGRIIGTTITGNTIRNCGDVGIEVGSGSVDTTVTGNDIVSANGGGVNSSGILIRDAKGVSVTGNSIAGYTGASSSGIVSVALNGMISTGLSITGNSVRGARDGIKIQDADGISITGGSVIGTGADGIKLVNPTRFTVDSVIVHQSGENGITLGTFAATSAVDGSVTNCVVSDSAFTVAARDGITAFHNSANFILSGNRCFDTRTTGKTQRYGINITTTTVTNYNVLGNVLTGNATGGLSDSGPASPKNVTNNL